MRSGSPRLQLRRVTCLVAAALTTSLALACGASPHVKVTGRLTERAHKRDAMIMGALELHEASPRPESGGTRHDLQRRALQTYGAAEDAERFQQIDHQGAAGSRADQKTLARALRAYHDTVPPLELVLAQVRRAYRGHGEALESMVKRARLRGLVPELRISARRGQGVDLRKEGTDETNLRLSTDDSLSLEATLSFDLGELVYADDEPRLYALQARKRAAQREVFEAAEATYFAHLALFLKIQTGTPTADQIARFAELTAHLDGLTAGWFSRHAAAARTPASQ